MIAQALPDLVPQVSRHDRGVVSTVNLALMSDPADVDRVRQDLVDVSTAEQAAAGGAATAIDADRNPNPLSVELLFEAHDVSRLEIAAEQGPHDCCMILDDAQGALLDSEPSGTTPPIQIPFFFEAAILSRIRSPVTSRSNWAKDRSTFRGAVKPT